MTGSAWRATAGTAVASRLTSSSAASTIAIVTSSSLRTRTSIRLTSRRPSPLGEKCRVIFLMPATWGALLSRWATKKAANVAATRSTKTARAKTVTGVCYGAWSAPARTTTSASGASACVSSSSGSRLEIESSSPTLRADGRKPSAK